MNLVNEEFFITNWMSGTLFESLPIEIIDIIWKYLHNFHMKDIIDHINERMTQFCITYDRPIRLRAIVDIEEINPVIKVEPLYRNILIFNQEMTPAVFMTHCENIGLYRQKDIPKRFINTNLELIRLYYTEGEERNIGNLQY